jgi:hypothetical protein
LIHIFEKREILESKKEKPEVFLEVIETIKSWVQSHKGAKPVMKKQPDTYRSSQFLGL